MLLEHGFHFQSPILRVGHCNVNDCGVRVSLNVLFQSPILRVGHCNCAPPELEDHIGTLSVPYSPGRSLQPTVIGSKVTLHTDFQSPILRVGHCNGLANCHLGRVTPSFSPLFSGSVTATDRVIKKEIQ